MEFLKLLPIITVNVEVRDGQLVHRRLTGKEDSGLIRPALGISVIDSTDLQVLELLTLL